MYNNNIIIFLTSIIYCIVILGLTYLFVHKKVKFHLQNIVSFGTGVLVILVFFDFLPHTLSAGNNSLYSNIILIIAGLSVNAFSEMSILPRMKFLNRLLPVKKHDCHQHDFEHIHYHLIPTSVGCSAVGCLILCAFFDGIRLASALMIDIKTTVMMSIGLLFHLIPESVTVIGIGLSSGLSRKSLYRIVLLFCLTFLFGYHAFFLLSHIEYLQNFVIPFASGLFLYICFIHLIPMIFKCKTKKWFFMGALLFMILLQSSHLIFHH